MQHSMSLVLIRDPPLPGRKSLALGWVIDDTWMGHYGM